MDTILILQSMYPLPDELVLSPATQAAIEDGSADPGSIPEYVCVLRLPLDPVEDEIEGKRLNEMDKADEVEIKITIPNPLAESTSSSSNSNRRDEKSIGAPTHPTLKLHCLPSELIRADVDSLEKRFQALQSHEHNDPTHSKAEDQPDPVDWITTTISSFLPTISHSLFTRRTTNSQLHPPEPDLSSPNHPANPPEPLERCYLWFPSLSTPSKRRDLVTYASRYDLTGFVLAGKPGLLCLEGKSTGFGRYLNDIKNESWSDIPSYQKKVTERTRHPITHRAFPNMREITELIDQRGTRGNRGDMRQVKEWMAGFGLEDEFGFVMGVV